MKNITPIWKKTGAGNETIGNEDFHISYNPSPSMGRGKETALCVKGNSMMDNDWFILEGDFREEYEKVISKGLDACKKIYEDNKKGSRSSWSNDKTTDQDIVNILTGIAK